MTNTYLLYGTETVLIEEWVDKLVKKYLTSGKDDINYTVVNLENSTLDYVIELAETVPFMGDYRVIIVHGADFFGNVNKQYDLERLYNFITNPPPYSIVVFRTNIEKLDKRKKITKYIEEMKTAIEFAQLQGKNLDKWIINRANSFNCSIEQEAIGLLIYTAGTDLTTLAKEIEKLCLYVNNNKITSDDIKLLVTRTLEQNIFLIIDNIAQKKIALGLQAIYDLVKNKVLPTTILSQIAQKFRIMLIVKELQEIGYSSQQIATQTNKHPYYIKVTYQQSNAFSKANLLKIIKQIAIADESIKTGKLNDLVALEKLVLSLTK